MTSPLVDRDAERAELRALLTDGQPKLALLYGRRRIGKTHLLNHVWPQEQTFYFTASNTTPEQNRRQLIAEAAQWSGEDLRPDDFGTWRAVFNMLLDLRAPNPVVVVLDEFQYLGEDADGLGAVASELNAAWERRRPQRPFVLVLSGSAVSVLAALDTATAPLYGRFSWKGELRPFNYWHAAEMARFRSLRDRAIAFGLYGGTPRYLATIKPGQSLATNVARNWLSPRGEVRSLVETALVQEEGLRETAVYTAILRAIADGHTRINEIAQHSGVPNATPLRDKIDRLISLGYVEARRNFDAKPNAAVQYRVADPAFMFYYTFVVPNESALAHTDPNRVWRRSVVPRLDTYMGHIFERIVEQGYARLADRDDLPIVREWGRWEGRDRIGQSIELDIVAVLDDNRMMTGAVKWNAKPIGPEVFTQHVAALDRLADSGIAWAHRARDRSALLIFGAAGGFSSSFERAAAEDGRTVLMWSLRDLYVK